MFKKKNVTKKKILCVKKIKKKGKKNDKKEVKKVIKIESKK